KMNVRAVFGDSVTIAGTGDIQQRRMDIGAVCQRLQERSRTVREFGMQFADDVSSRTVVLDHAITDYPHAAIQRLGDYVHYRPCARPPVPVRTGEYPDFGAIAASTGQVIKTVIIGQPQPAASVSGDMPHIRFERKGKTCAGTISDVVSLDS